MPERIEKLNFGETPNTGSNDDTYEELRIFTGGALPQSISEPHPPPPQSPQPPQPPNPPKPNPPNLPQLPANENAGMGQTSSYILGFVILILAVLALFYGIFDWIRDFLFG